MLKIDPIRGETTESLMRQAIHAPHPRLRERFQALYMIAPGLPGTMVARELNRNRNTILFTSRGPSIKMLVIGQPFVISGIWVLGEATIQWIVAPRKRLKKADPEEQMDRGQIWCDALLRWIWCLRGGPPHASPSKEDKISFYVAVARHKGLVITSIVESFNKGATAEFLDKIRANLFPPIVP
ncbi:MAG: hypothetical protein ACUVXI_02060 [bacterium]